MSVKIFFKRFWWIFVIFGIGLMILIILVVSSSGDKGSGEKDKKISEDVINNEIQYNERVVKTFLPDSGAAFKYNSPLLRDGYLYLGTSCRTGYDNAPIANMPDNFFYKMDLDFNIVWQYPLKKRMVNGGAVMDSNSNLYFIVEQVIENPDLTEEQKQKEKEKEYFADVYLISLDGDGNFRWEKPISEEGDFWNRSMHAPAISADDIIYVGEERFFAFDAGGNLLAEYPENGRKIIGYGGAPVIDSAGYVYFTAPEPIQSNQNYNTEVSRVYKFSPKLASLVWSTELGNEIMSELDPDYTSRKGMGVESTPALSTGGKYLYGITGSTISKIDTTTGELAWATKPEGIIGYINASPVIDAEDNVYIGSKSNEYSKFFAIKSDGTLLWKKDIGADLYSSPILGDDNNIYVGSETVELPSGKFHVLDRFTGEEKWAIGTNNEKTMPDFSFCGMLLYQGYIYIGSHTAMDENDQLIRNQVLFKIKVDADGYLPAAAWPRIHGGNSNSGRIEI